MLAAGFGVFSPTLVGTIFVSVTILTLLGGVAHWHKLESSLRIATSRDPSDVQTVVAQPAILVCDPGRGVGSELSCVLLRVMRDLGHLDVKCVIANLHPQAERARFLRGTLDTLGMHDVPVGVGTNGGSGSGQERFFEGAQNYVPEEGSVRANTIITGRSLLQKAFEQAPAKSMTLILLSSLKDAAIFLRDHEALFVEKIISVVIAGGAEEVKKTNPFRRTTSVETLNARASGVQISPGFAPTLFESKIQCDVPAAEYFYSRCQQLGVPLVIVPDEAAHGVTVPRQLYDEFADGGSLIGWRLREVCVNFLWFALL